jgi:hypothetical protein
MDLFGYHIPGLFGVGAAFASVYGAFAKFDADQSSENRRFVRDWLLGLKVDDQKWEAFFRELFTRFFGPKHLSVKCALRSAILSTSIVIGIVFIRHITIADFEWEPAAVFLIALLITFICTIDYLCLWKTRVLLTKVPYLNRGLIALLLVLGDFISTILTFLLVWILFGITYDYLMGVGPQIIIDDAKYNLHMFTDSRVRLLYLSALLTSAWLWVYLVVAHTMRLLRFVPSTLNHVSKVMDFQDHPVRTLGYVAAAVSAGIVLIIVTV